MWIQNNLGGEGACPHPPENFEINGAFWGLRRAFLTNENPFILA